jgi:hypothetical protein
MVANSNSGGGGNIFFTMENLAFSLPLLLVCSGYVSEMRVIALLFLS